MGPGVAGGPTAAAVVAASEGKAKKYGLLGLLGVIRMTDPDLNMLALGSDLTTVGLNLDSAEVRGALFVYHFLNYCRRLMSTSTFYPSRLLIGGLVAFGRRLDHCHAPVGMSTTSTCVCCDGRYQVVECNEHVLVVMGSMLMPYTCTQACNPSQ